MSYRATAGIVARMLGQFARGVPGERSGLTSGIMNATGVLRFLLGRKLGLPGGQRVRLGHGGKSHAWSLVERSDVSVLQEIFLEREYALDIAPPSVVLDLGANFGAASVYFAQAWPEARIYAVEPNPDTFTRLVATTKSYPGITCLNLAVGERDGAADFVVASDHIGSSLYRPDPAGRTVEVETLTLASLLRELRLDRVGLLKFDVEGAEEFLFQDTSVLARIDALVGEVHSDLMKMTEADFLGQFGEFDVTRRSSSGDLFVMSAIRRRS